MLNEQQVSDVLVDLLQEAGEEWQRLDKFSRYHRGEHDDPYSPKQRSLEFIALSERSKTNLIPLVVDTLVDRLYVDGFRPDLEDSVQNSPAWQWWQENSFDSRQKQVYKSTGIYGYSYVQVWPGQDGTPVFRPYSPRAWYAKYDFFDDDWPIYAVRSNGDRVWLLDDEALYVTRKLKGSVPARYDLEQVVPHGLGVTPLVRFVNSWPDEGAPPVGETEAVIHISDRLNQSVFDLLQAQSFQGVPQRYVTNLAVDDFDELAKVVQGAQRFLGFKGEAQVGQLPAADLKNLVVAIDNTIRVFGQVSRTPPHHLVGEMVNISAEALVAAEASLSSKIEERQTLHGESWEQLFRLAGVAAGSAEIASDTASQVIWRSTDPRSMASTVDALGKMVQMLHVPADETWSMIPGITQTDVSRWRQKAEQGDPFVMLQNELKRQADSIGGETHGNS